MGDLPDITPDTKDWTWTVTRRCPDCAADAGEVTGDRLADAIRAAVAPWPGRLQWPHVDARPAPTTWSPVEYACHVRDVCRVFDGRLHLMLDRDDPPFHNWDQDAASVAGRYADQDPTRVGSEIMQSAEQLATSYGRVTGGQWDRTGQRGGGARFTVLTLGQYCLHDLVHHLHDVGVSIGR
ncbi:DinB family protein [Leekyejoonella antrihumi]|uniref:DinB family protein n=1 Tax=Leekyejoonella antrihumi TaxID=1660198 RepID=A0A563DXZ2_9MICO|nr:DinB family protein [Leekyejoonella antrihumi]TWP35097.1 DinB family protein [Leekyejoonella antrihumi]